MSAISATKGINNFHQLKFHSSSNLLTTKQIISKKPNSIAFFKNARNSNGSTQGELRFSSTCSGGPLKMGIAETIANAAHFIQPPMQTRLICGSYAPPRITFGYLVRSAAQGLRPGIAGYGALGLKISRAQSPPRRLAQANPRQLAAPRACQSSK